MFGLKQGALLSAHETLPGRQEAVSLSGVHVVLNSRMLPPFGDDLSSILLGLGCFWGAERLFWRQHGVYTTAVGYAGGSTPNPTYDEVCSGLTNHAEVVLVVYDPARLTLESLLRLYWEAHDPTQGMRQGNDRGTQYRSVVYTPDAASLAVAEASRDAYQLALTAAGLGSITTEIRSSQQFWYAEEYHQQYLAKNPAGYCGLRGTGVSCAL